MVAESTLIFLFLLFQILKKGAQTFPRIFLFQEGVTVQDERNSSGPGTLGDPWSGPGEKTRKMVVKWR